MTILILSDVHGNWPALQAVLAAEPAVDQILCLGDLVNYGPQPVECVQWAMDTLSSDWLVQGNHDRAVARDESSRSSAACQALAVATQQATLPLFTPQMKQFLAGLQPVQRFLLDSAVCQACHAVPSDPLYHYLTETSPVPLWESELNLAQDLDLTPAELFDACTRKHRLNLPRPDPTPDRGQETRQPEALT
ncbi:MAG TPA: metallophosphoesterase family protein [Candidatus Paceibacterota bacterium]|nr:metallophosphoesterase family protein [Candidatus Paceibacterota bacterium]